MRQKGQKQSWTQATAPNTNTLERWLNVPPLRTCKRQHSVFMQRVVYEVTLSSYV